MKSPADLFFAQLGSLLGAWLAPVAALIGFLARAFGADC